ncbi:MAG: hypothetical protein P4L22_04280, partial [Candidatus Babeliales bacterium]|nr:hypothetical protein [Candidatus Babeliales bacterium]
VCQTIVAETAPYVAAMAAPAITAISNPTPAVVKPTVKAPVKTPAVKTPPVKAPVAKASLGACKLGNQVVQGLPSTLCNAKNVSKATWNAKTKKCTVVIKNPKVTENIATTKAMCKPAKVFVYKK